MIKSRFKCLLFMLYVDVSVLTTNKTIREIEETDPVNKYGLVSLEMKEM